MLIYSYRLDSPRASEGGILMAGVDAKCNCRMDLPEDESERVAAKGNRGVGRQAAILGAAVVVWWVIYGQLAPLAEWATYGPLGLERGSHLADAVEFFLYDTPKVLMLLTLVVFGVGVIRSFFTAGADPPHPGWASANRSATSWRRSSGS